MLAQHSLSPIPRDTTGFILHFIDRPLIWGLAFIGISTFFAQTAELGVHILTGALVDALKSDQSQKALWIAVGLIGLNILWRLAYLLMWKMDYSLNLFGRFKRNIQLQLFEWTLDHSPSYFKTNFAGDLSSKIQQASIGAGTILHSITFTGSRITIGLSLAAFWLSLTSPIYLLLLLLWSILFIKAYYPILLECHIRSKKSAEQSSRVAAGYTDVFSNVSSVFSFAGSTHEKRRMDWSLKKEGAVNRHYRKILVKARTIQYFFMALLVALLLSILTWQSIHHQISLGNLVVVLGLSFQIVGFIQQAVDQMILFLDNSGAIQSATALLLSPHDNPDSKKAVDLQVNHGGLQFDNVSFAYPGQDPLFHRLNFEVKPGERVGVVGHSGSGKSTLFKLLKREYTLGGGRILIDQQDLRDVTIDSLRKSISEVSQDVTLFHRSILSNIEYADPLTSFEDVQHAAVAIQCLDFISKKPKKFKTMVGSHGGHLSGGERQRLLIARASLKKSKLLLLDEATSAMDSKTEQNIQTALLEIMKGRTVLAIAHRLSTLVHMDRILVLDQGEIAEEGSHQELIKKRGIYFTLWSHQHQGFMID